MMFKASFIVSRCSVLSGSFLVSPEGPVHIRSIPCVWLMASRNTRAAFLSLNDADVTLRCIRQTLPSVVSTFSPNCLRML